MKIITNPMFETKIKKAFFFNQDILVFPQKGEVPNNIIEVVKFLFGDYAAVEKDFVYDSDCIRIVNAGYVLKDVKTINADFVITKLQEEVLK